MRKDKGLSIIEVILAVVIISICVIAMASLFQGILRGSPDVKSLTVATALSEEAMERALGISFNEISNGSYSKVFNFSSPFNASSCNCSSNSSCFDYRLNVFYVNSTHLDTPAANATEYKRVEVTVKYGQNCNRNVSAVSLLTNYTN